MKTLEGDIEERGPNWKLQRSERAKPGGRAWFRTDIM
jgi:hypothetical protein